MKHVRVLVHVCTWLVLAASISLATEMPPQVNSAATSGESLPKQESSLMTSPPAIYQRGISLRREGKYEEAAGHFFAAAQKGMHLAEVELAYLHADAELPMWDDPAAFAWFTLAIKHESNPTQARILNRDREVVRLRMSSAEQTEARRLSGVLLSNLGAVPTYTEAK